MFLPEPCLQMHTSDQCLFIALCPTDTLILTHAFVYCAMQHLSPYNHTCIRTRMHTHRNLRVIDNDVVLTKMSHKLEPLESNTRTHTPSSAS